MVGPVSETETPARPQPAKVQTNYHGIRAAWQEHRWKISIRSDQFEQQLGMVSTCALESSKHQFLFQKPAFPRNPNRKHDPPMARLRLRLFASRSLRASCFAALNIVLLNPYKTGHTDARLRLLKKRLRDFEDGLLLTSKKARFFLRHYDTPLVGELTPRPIWRTVGS